MSTRKTLFVIDGFEVKENSTYVIKDKVDMDAPTGYIKAGVTKLPSRGVSETFQVNFISRDGGRTGTWDTGFYEYSPCYRDVDSSEIKTLVTGLKKNLLLPYRHAIGDDSAFELSNNAFFDKTNFKVYSKKTYNTLDPIDRMELYFGLLTKQITPKGQEGNTRYNDSSYVVVDVSKDIKIKDERALSKFSAIGAFTAMLKTDKPRLVSILHYTGMNFSASIEDSVLIGMFNDYLSGENDDKTKAFNRLVEETETKEGLEKITIYKAIREAYKKGGKVTKISGLYFYEDKEIGPDLKNSAENIARNSSLASVKRDILLADDED